MTGGAVRLIREAAKGEAQTCQLQGTSAESLDAGSRAAGPNTVELKAGTAAGRLAAAVATAAHAHRGLRRARAQLQGDLAALLGGLRPAVMLDYVVVPTDVVAALVGELADAGGAA